MAGKHDTLTCKNGHPKTVDNTNKRGGCKACVREYYRRWYEANSEKAKENSRRWREANPEKAKESDRRRREANPEKAKENSRRWYEANPEKAKENSRRWYEANQEKAKENGRRRYEANPEKAKENGRRVAQQITKSYIAANIGMPVSQLSDRLYQLAKDRLVLRRITRTARKQGGEQNGYIACNA